MLVGLVGWPGAGKDTVASLLKKRGFFHISLGNILRAEASSRGLPLDRLELQDLSVRLKRRFGSGFLAELALKKMKSSRDYVVSSICHPAEVKALVDRFDFVLVEVRAPLQTRFERLKKNKGVSVSSVDQFQFFESFKMGGVSFAFDLPATLELAKIVVLNDCSKGELKVKLDLLLSDLAKNF